MTAPGPLTPYELGQRDRKEAIAGGEIPSREALDKAAAVIAASQGRQADPGQADGAAA